METSDSALLDRWTAHGDAAAFAAIVARHASMVYATCQRLLANRADAEEMAQECFISLLGHPPKATATYASLGGWLHTVATNKALLSLRGNTRRSEREARYVREAVVPEAAAWDDLQDYVDEAIATLPDKLRHPIVSHFLEGRSYGEISRTQSIPRSTVATRVAKGIDEIRKQLRKRGITVTSSALASFFTVASSEAAPATLTAALGKYALGAGHAGISSVGALQTAVPFSSSLKTGGVILSMKKAGIAIAVLACIISAGLLSLQSTEIHQDRKASPSEKADTTRIKEAVLSPPITPIAEVKNAIAPIESEPEEVSGITPPEVQTLEPGQIVDPSQYGSIAGLVLDEDGYAIAHADVMCIATGAGTDNDDKDEELSSFFYEDEFREAFDQTLFDRRHHFSALSGPQGKFRIGGVAYEGKCLLVASADGYNTAHKSVLVSPGDNLENVEIILRPGMTLSGRVVTRAGQPVLDAVVRNVGGMVGNGYWAGVTGTIAHTDRDGYFRLGHGGIGIAMLHVISPSQGQRTFIDLPVDGAEIPALVMGKMAAIMAHITWSHGADATNLPVILRGTYVFEHSFSADHSIRSADDGAVIKAILDEEGRHTFEGLDPGQTYTMDIFDLDGNMVVAKATIGDLAEGVVHPWNYVVDAPIRVSGRVTGETFGQPLEGIKVFYLRQGAGAFVMGDVTTDSDGLFQFSLLAEPGEYAIFPKYAHKNFFHASNDPYQALVTLKHGLNPAVNLSFPEPFSISFLVIDASGAPLPGVHVELPSGIGGAASEFSRDLYTDVEGRFSYDGFEPNKKTLVTFALEGFATAESTHYVSESGAQHEETVVLHGAAGVQGVILDPDGVPISHTWVSVTTSLEEGKAVSLDCRTDLDGFFSIATGIPATLVWFEITVSTESLTYSWQSEEIEVPPGQILDLGVIQMTLNETEASQS